MKENKKILKRKERGITLIALVITIIVLLILAGVSIAMLTGENGMLTQAQRAKTETENAQAEEQNILANYESVINSYSGENTEFIDNLGNKIIVPAGFKVVNPEDNVEDGIVIEDVTHGATAGSQFVWIPVGKDIKKSDGTTFDIKLSRYTFDNNGILTDKENEIIESFQELNKGNGNITAKENIESEEEGFRKSAIDNGGYYIGRYEARTEIERIEKTEASKLTQITVRPNDYVYNYVTQIQAANLSQNMYKNDNFESDLMNSYAWDTTVDFLQKCDDRIDRTNLYSTQNSLNTSEIASKGTNGLVEEDEICNVFDMASNCLEWTTETSNNPGYYCTIRGGSYISGPFCTMYRYNAYDGRNGYTLFRPILYIK